MINRISALVLGIASLAAAPAFADPSYTLFDAPHAGTTPGLGTRASAVNVKGVVVGLTIGDDDKLHGFVRHADGTFTSYNNFAGDVHVNPYSINKSGRFAGQYTDSASHGFVGNKKGKIKPFDVEGMKNDLYAEAIGDGDDVTGHSLSNQNRHRSFVRDKKGNTVVFGAPDAGIGSLAGTFSLAVNAGGDTAGYYMTDDSVSHGFVRAAGGTIAEFDAAGAGTGSKQGTTAYGIDDSGVAAGTSIDAGNVLHGFVRDADGTMHAVDVAGAGTGAGQGTFARSINAKGTVTGWYIDAGGVNHGFIRSRSGKVVTFDVAGAGHFAGQGTIPQNIDADGVVVGSYVDSANVWHGFIRTP